MASSVVHAGTAMLCTHGGSATVAPAGGRVLVEGQPVVTASAVCVVAGCAGAPQPCATGRWLAGGSRVLVSGEPVVTVDSPSVCEPGGAPIVVVAAAAARVVAG